MNIAKRMMMRREQLGLSQLQLAKRCGWKYQSKISSYESGKRTPPITVIRIIEKALEVYPGWLIKDGDTEMAIAELKQKGKIGSDAREIPIRQIPLYTLEEIAMQEKGKLLLHPSREIIIAEEGLENCKAFKVIGDAMVSQNKGPSFAEGDIVFVNSDRKAVSGNYVVACLDDKPTVVFKQYVIDAGRAYLRSLNPVYPVIEFKDDSMQIVAVAVKKYIISDLL